MTTTTKLLEQFSTLEDALYTAFKGKIPVRVKGRLERLYAEIKRMEAARGVAA
jgi:hypothetical protein